MQRWQVWLVCRCCETRLAVEPGALAAEAWDYCPVCEGSPLQAYIEDPSEEYA